MPDDADTPITRRTARLPTGLVAARRFAHPEASPLQPSRAQRFGDRSLHRVELVVARHLLGERAAPVVLEHDEVADKGQQPAPGADPLDKHLQLRQLRVGQGLPRYRAPRLEPLPRGSQRSDAGFQSIRHDECRVEREQRGDLGLVGLKLLKRGPDRRILGGRVLQLDDTQRQPVDEQHDVRPAFVLVLNDRELVDCQPVVRPGSVEVNHADLRATDRPIGADVLHRDAIDDHAMKGAVASLQRRTRWVRHSTEGVI